MFLQAELISIPRSKNINFIEIGPKLSYSCKSRDAEGSASDTPKHPPIADFWLRAWLLQLMGDKLKNE